MFGDAAVSFGGIEFITGLDIDEFQTYRYESLDGVNYRISVDGQVFIERAMDNPNGYHYLQLGGRGGCELEDLPTRNEWDHVWYGTISSGERLIAADPPAGYLDPQVYAALDRFTVTFDVPAYVYVDDVTVAVTGGAAPSVMQTRRLDNSDPETVEIVLSGPMPLGKTTTFTFDTGLTPPDENTLAYTLAPPPPGACCNDATGVCSESVTLSVCEGTDRRFGGSGSSCTTIDPPCVPPPPGACCNDEIALCTDGVTAADCESMGRRFGGAGSDCTTIDPPCSPTEIPAASTWGLTVLTLLLLVVGKILFARPSAPQSQNRE